MKRRDVLKISGRAAAALSIIPSSALGVGRTAPLSRITVGMIGVGNQGRHHTRHLLGMHDVQVAAVCDPVRANRLAAKQLVEKSYGASVSRGTFKGCGAYNDFRKLLARDDIDAVFIASPEHWHALHTIHAAKAGKDIYCEKAMSRTIAEGQAMVRAVRRYCRVFQTGTQQRSSGKFRKACQLVRNGYIGKLHTIKVGDPKGHQGPKIRNLPVPEGIDYDMWLGPACWGPYFPQRLINLKGWMLCYDYTVGFQSGWGQHDIDIAQWGNGTDHTGPVEVEGRATFPKEGLNDTAMTWHTEYTYTNGVRLIFTSDNENPHGIRFEGTDGWIFVNRRTLQAKPISLLKVSLKSSDAELYNSNSHHRNFFDCVRSRRDPICPVEVGHRTNVICNLSDIATRLGRKLRWNPQKERFADDVEANRMLSCAMRPPWRL